MLSLCAGRPREAGASVVPETNDQDPARKRRPTVCFLTRANSIFETRRAGPWLFTVPRSKSGNSRTCREGPPEFPIGH